MMELEKSNCNYYRNDYLAKKDAKYGGCKFDGK